MKKRLFDIFVWIMTFVFIMILMTLPDKIPIHWNFNWEVDGYGSKYTMLLIMLIPIVFHYGMLFLMKIDPKKKRFGKRAKTYEILRKFTTVILILMVLFFIYMARNPLADGKSILMLLLGIMFIVIGNYMPKIPQNYFMGIKTPWTLSNEKVWKKTHLVGGYSFVIMGLICVVCGLMSFEHSSVVVIGCIIIEVVVTFGYSYYIFKKLNQEEDGVC